VQGNRRLLFDHASPAAFQAREQPISAGSVTKKTPLKTRYSDRSDSTSRGFKRGQYDFDIKIFDSLALGPFEAGKIPQYGPKKLIERRPNRLEVRENRHRLRN
jgi:hypothetical protein